MRDVSMFRQFCFAGSHFRDKCGKNHHDRVPNLVIFLPNKLHLESTQIQSSALPYSVTLILSWPGTSKIRRPSIKSWPITKRLIQVKKNCWHCAFVCLLNWCLIMIKHMIKSELCAIYLIAQNGNRNVFFFFFQWTRHTSFMIAQGTWIAAFSNIADAAGSWLAHTSKRDQVWQFVIMSVIMTNLYVKLESYWTTLAKNTFGLMQKSFVEFRFAKYLSLFEVGGLFLSVLLL